MLWKFNLWLVRWLRFLVVMCWFLSVLIVLVCWFFVSRSSMLGVCLFVSVGVIVMNVSVYRVIFWRV